MKVRDLNDGQYQAVTSRHSSILVSAPAGSGKTKILVSRIMSLIIDDYYQINEFLILTFTKAAALEMKQRLVKELDQEIIKTHNQDLKDHLLQQKILLNDAYVTNFHSFCSDLLSQYGSVIGLSNQFEIIENPTLIKNNVFQQCLSSWVQDDKFKDFFSNHYVDYHFKEFQEMVFQLDNLSSTIYNFDGYINAIKELIYFPIIQTNSYENTPIGESIKHLLLDSLFLAATYQDTLEDFCRSNGLEFFFEDAKKQSPNIALIHYFRKISQINKEGIDAMITKTNFEVEDHRNASYKNLEVDERVKKQYTDLLKKAKTTYLNTYQKLTAYINDQSPEILALTLEDLDTYLYYLKEFQSAYQHYKQDKGYLDFNDLEKYCLELLEPQYGVSETLYHQLKEIMIDEYQDTNEIQETIITKISHYQDPAIYRFMVGDMKQSIYRFRKADLEIFNKKYLSYTKDIESDAVEKRIDLQYNYRSSKIVLDSINFIFNQIMDPDYGGLEYYYDPTAQLNYDYLRKESCQSEDEYEDKKAQAIARLNKEDRFTTEVLLALKPEDRHVDMVEYEAKMMVKKITDMVGILDLDQYQAPTKKADYQDIVVLLRNVSSFMTYKKVFDKYNIPNLIILTKGFFESPEIIDCIAFLKAINNCYDDISLMSVLTGHYAFSNFDPSTILKIKQEDLSLYESLLQDPTMASFIDYYHAMVEYSRHHAAYQVLEKFLEDSQYHIFVSALYNGKQRLENIRLLMQTLKNDQKLSLCDIIDKIDLTCQNNIDYKPATISADNAVTFMTIHKSKGLEFPIVFVSALQHQFNFADSSAKIVNDRHVGFALNPRRKVNIGEYQDVIVEYPHPFKSTIGEYLNTETVNEEMRILYVALTRASQKLILTGTMKSHQQIIDWMQDVLTYNKEDFVVLPDFTRNVKSYLDWILMSLVRHPDFINQCFQETVFDSYIKNREDLSEFMHLAHTLKLHEIPLDVDNIMHSKFHIQVLDSQTIDQYTIVKPKFYAVRDLSLYQNLQNYQYPMLEETSKTVAVTKIIDDGNRQYPDLQYQDRDPSSIQANDRGTIIHRVLELLPLQDQINLDLELNNIIKQENYNEEIASLIMNYRQHLQAFIDSDVYQLMKTCDHLYKEKTFSLLDDNQQIIHGIFDVVAIHQDQITIIDYKTDTIKEDTNEDTLKQLHYEQMAYYKKILARVFPQANIQAIVYYLAIHRYVIL